MENITDKVTRNLRANMALCNVTIKDISEALDITRQSVSNKLNGRTIIRLDEAIIIRDKLFKDYTLGKLFLNEE